MTRPDENKDKASFELSDEELKRIVAETDTGGRKPTGFAARVLLLVALGWSLLQLWIASPLPFSLGIGAVAGLIYSDVDFNLLPTLTVLENLCLPLEINHLPRDMARRRVKTEASEMYHAPSQLAHCRGAP